MIRRTFAKFVVRRHHTTRFFPFLLGFVEGNDAFGVTWNDDPWAAASQSYDRGRTVRERTWF